MTQINSIKLSSRTALVDGGVLNAQSGSRGEGKQYNSRAEIPLPSGSIRSPVPALKSFDVAQSLLDGLAVVGGLLALVVVFGSIPLAVGMMIFAAF